VSERFNQYKQSDKGDVGYRWVIFDNEMPDDVLSELMATVEPDEISRGKGTSVVGFYTDASFEYGLLRKSPRVGKEFRDTASRGKSR
jgi:hypothetical protein